MRALMATRAKPVFLGGAATLLMIAARGLAYGIHDHSMLIPIVRHLADARDYAGDYLFSALQGYSTFFYSLVASWHMSERGLTAFFLYGTVLMAALVLMLVAAACQRQGATPPEAFLGSLGLALGYNPSLGHSFFDLALSHALPGILLGLMALFLLETGRPRLAFAVAGLLLNIHGMYAVTVLAILTFASLLEKPRPWARILSGLTIALALGLPVIVAQMRMPTANVPLVSWIQILRVRDSMHIFVEDVPMSDWVAFVTFFALLARPWRPPAEPFGWSPLLSSAVLTAGLGILAAVLFVEWHPVAAVVKLAPLRCTFWLYIVGLPVWARSFSEGLRHPAITTPSALALVSLFQQPLSLKVLALAYVASTMIVRRRGQDWLRRLGIAYIAVVLVMTLGRPAMKLLGVPPPQPWPLTGFHTFAVLVTLAVAWAFTMGRERRRDAAASAMICLVATLGAAQGLMARGGALLRAEASPWLDVQRWARRATPADATFVIPVDLEGFRIESWRPQYVDWKDGTLGNFNPEFAQLWWERMVSLGIDFNVWKEPERAQARYRSLDSARLCVLAGDTRLDYVISEDPSQMADLPLVYSNERFQVRRIRCARESGSVGGSVRTSPIISASSLSLAQDLSDPRAGLGARNVS
jgi:uncharacterized protein DUF6798